MTTSTKKQASASTAARGAALDRRVDAFITQADTLIGDLDAEIHYLLYHDADDSEHCARYQE